MPEMPGSTPELAAEVVRLRRQLEQLERRGLGGSRDELGLLRSFVAALPDIAFILDENGRFVDVVKAQAPLFEADASGLPGRDVRDLLPAAVVEEALQKLKQTVQSGEPQLIEYELEAPAGKRCLEARLLRMSTQPGTKPSVACVVRDISARKQADEELRRSEARLHAVIECLPFDFWAIGPDGCYAMQNSTCRRNWGNVIGLRPEDAAPTEEIRAIWTENNRRAFSGELVEGEVVYQQDGKNQHFLNLIAPISDRDDIIGVLGINLDITAQKTLADQLQKTQKLESLGLLAGGIAHDFNNLLMAIGGHISLSRVQAEIGNPSDDLLAEAEKACLRAQTLTQQLLTFAKGGQPVREAASIADLVRESARFATSGSRCRCELDIPEDLWPAFADLSQLHQVINNLVINSVQAMPDGGTIGVSCANVDVGEDSGLPLGPGMFVRFSVEDAGVGIKEEHLPRIFDPYFTTNREGHGLGLAVAYAIVDKHRGCISVDSSEGNGTVVDVYLPAADPAVAAAPVVEEPLKRGSGRILVLDDEAALRNVTGVMLQTLGYAPTCAASCEEAVVEFEHAWRSGAPFRAAILDLTVPGGPGGKECLQRLRRIDPNLKAIVSSGYSTDAVLAEFERFGFAAVLRKPFRREQLGEALQQVLRSEAEGSR